MQQLRAIGYIRVSTAGQAAEGHSLAEQQKRLEAVTVFKGIDSLTLIEDSGMSAATLNRPGIRDLLESVRNRDTDYVLVTALDRLTRSIRDLQTILDLFQESDVELISAGESLDTSTAAGRMVVNIMGVFAQWERETTLERTKNIQKELKAEGKAIGPPPYGYSTDEGGYLTLNRTEQNALDLMRSLKSAKIPLIRIAESLTQRGYLNRHGRPFSVQGIFYLLKRGAEVASRERKEHPADQNGADAPPPEYP